MLATTKIINFYYLKPSPCMTLSAVDDHLEKYTHLLFSSAFKNNDDYYELETDKQKFFFDIKNFDTDYMFGTCSKDETFSATNFVQKRNIDTKEVSPFTTIDSEEKLEAYTFFYIDFKCNRMAVIYNKKISKIHNLISEFIYKESGNMSMIEIFPEKIDDIKRTSNTLMSLKSLEIEFACSKSKYMIHNIFDSLGGDFVPEKYKLGIKLSTTGKKFIDDIIHFRKTNKDITTLKLTGKNDLGVEETINFITMLYTKSVPIQLSDDSAVNIEYIKMRLKEHLNSRLWKFT